MRCLITGATGFTGGHLARTLKAQGHQVRALARPGANVAHLQAQGIEIVYGQLVNSSSVEVAARGCEQIYHIAAVYRTAGHTDQHYFEVNVGGTQNVLDAARKLGCERVIHCSTIGVHGHVEHPPAKESYRFAPDDVYQRSKVEGELVVARAQKAGQPAVIFRPGAIYGEGDTRFLKLFKAVAKRRFVMIGSGQTRLHLVHVDDLVEGIILCGTRPQALGQVFILAGPQAPTLNEITALIAKATNVAPPFLKIPVAPVYAAGWLCEMLCIPFGIEPPLHRRRVGFFTHHREFDCSNAARRIGYAPRVGPAEGIRRTAEWYRRQGLL
jgi:nucleoside-diphosphate-sugar epimerase